MLTANAFERKKPSQKYCSLFASEELFSKNIRLQTISISWIGYQLQILVYSSKQAPMKPFILTELDKLYNLPSDRGLIFLL